MRRRGPNLNRSHCKECGADLTWKNHIFWMGRYCRQHYNEREKVRKGLGRIDKERTENGSGSTEVL